MAFCCRFVRVVIRLCLAIQIKLFSERKESQVNKRIIIIEKRENSWTDPLLFLM